MAATPDPLASYPPLVAGAEGERYVRPSERKHEAKDLNKLIQKGAASQGRIAQPHGMVLGGGMGDYVMRGRDVFEKTLAWPGGTTSAASSSVVRYQTYPLGGLSDVAFSWDSSAVDQPCAQGVPVLVETLLRAKGAFSFEHDTAFYYRLDAGATAATTTTFAASYFVSSTPAVSRNINLSIASGGGNSTTAATQSTMGSLGIGRLKVLWKFSPPSSAQGAGEIGQNLDGITGVDQNDIKYWCYMSLEYGNPAAALDNGVSLTQKYQPFFQNRVAQGFIPIADNITTIWLDLSIRNDLASNTTNNYVRVFYSKGSTLSGHDGYPFNYVTVKA